MGVLFQQNTSMFVGVSELVTQLSVQYDFKVPNSIFLKHMAYLNTG